MKYLGKLSIAMLSVFIVLHFLSGISEAMCFHLWFLGWNENLILCLETPELLSVVWLLVFFFAVVLVLYGLLSLLTTTKNVKFIRSTMNILSFIGFVYPATFYVFLVIDSAVGLSMRKFYSGMTRVFFGGLVRSSFYAALIFAALFAVIIVIEEELFEKLTDWLTGFAIKTCELAVVRSLGNGEFTEVKRLATKQTFDDCQKILRNSGTVLREGECFQIVERKRTGKMIGSWRYKQNGELIR